MLQSGVNVDRKHFKIGVLDGSAAHLVIARSIMNLFNRLLHPFGIRGASTMLRLSERLLRGQHAKVIVDHPAGFRFVCPTYDPVWGHHIYVHRMYDESLFALFTQIKDSEFVFIDCGANVGYWSAVLASDGFGAHPTIAIEASASTFAVLEKTQNASLRRFTCLHRAVSERSDTEVEFLEDGRPEGRHIVEVTDAAERPKAVIRVKTVTLDALRERYFPNHRRFVVKIDFVWSVEIAAMKGAVELAQQEALFIYEEHGMDPACHATAYLIEHGFSVFMIKEGGRVLRMVDLEQVVAIKRPIQGRRVAFNMIATKRTELLKSFGIEHCCDEL
jgi:FkbM family methyltransferase